MNPDVQIIGADPEGSVYSGGTGRPYLVEGRRRGLLADDLRPDARRPGRSMVTDAESFDMTRRVTREEGLLVGGSCGMAVHAALVVGREVGPDAVVVVLLPGLRPRLPLEDLQRRLDDGLRVHPLRGPVRGRRAREQGRLDPRPRARHAGRDRARARGR